MFTFYSVLFNQLINFKCQFITCYPFCCLMLLIYPQEKNNWINPLHNHIISICCLQNEILQNFNSHKLHKKSFWPYTQQQYQESVHFCTDQTIMTICDMKLKKIFFILNILNNYILFFIPKFLELFLGPENNPSSKESLKYFQKSNICFESQMWL